MSHARTLAFPHKFLYRSIMTIKSTSLPNGIRIITDSLDGVESIGLGLWVGVGTRDEDKSQNGIAHMLEHMLFKGTEKRTAQDFAEVIENAGGHMNAYTGREMTAYYIHILNDYTELAVDVLSDMVRHSTFPEDELERERAVILQEIHMYEDTPDDLVFEKAQMAAYPNQTLGTSGLGTIDIVQQIKSLDLKNYLQARYHPEKMVVSAAGAVKHDEFVELVSRYFGDIAKSNSTVAPYEKANYSPSASLIEKDTEQTHLVMGFQGISHHDPRYSAMRVLASILGGGTSSRLWQEVREKRGLVYSIYSYRDSYHDDGQFGVYAGSSPDNLAILAPIILEEIVKLPRGISVSELNRAKTQIISGARMGREKVMTRVDQQGRHMLTYNSPFLIQDFIKDVELVSQEDVISLAQSVFSSPLLLSVVGTYNNLMSYEDMQKQLRVIA